MEIILGVGSLDAGLEQAACIVQAINDDDALNQQVWEALAASYAGDQSKADAVEGAIADAATKCIIE